MTMQRFAAVILAGFAGCAVPFVALAQEEAFDALAMGGVLQRDLERQVGEFQPSSSDAHELSVFFHKRGVANMRLGRYAQAIADLREALRLHLPSKRPTTPDEFGWRWQIDNDLVIALQTSGDLLGALEHSKSRPRGIATALLERWQGDLELNLGMVAKAELSYAAARRAMEAYRTSRAFDRMLDAGWSVSLEGLGARLLEMRGNPVEGERLRRRALERAGEVAEIVARLPPAHWWRVRQGPRLLYETKRNLANNLTAQGRFGEAEFLAREALAETLVLSAPRTVLVGLALQALGVIRLEQGRLDDAERLFRSAIDSLGGAQVLPHSTILALLRARRGTVLAIRGQWPEAQQVFEERHKGLRSHDEQFKTAGSFHLDWAMALHRAGQSAQALAQFDRMIDVQLRRPFADPVHIARLRGHRAIVLAAQGQVGEAAAEFAAALPPLLARAEHDASNESGGFVGAWRLTAIIGGYLELLARCHVGGCGLAGLDPVAEAFRIADVARGSAVQRAVTTSVARASLPDPMLRELARKEQASTNRIVSLRKIMERLVSSSADQRLAKIIGDMQKDIAQLETEQKMQRKDLADRYPEYANLVDPQPPSLADVQKALGPTEAALAIYVAEKESYVWTVTKERVAFRVVAKGRAEVAQEVAGLQAGLEFDGGVPRSFSAARAHALYRDFLAGDAALWSNAKVLNVIPHGPLGQLPFGMLLTEPAENVPMGQTPWLIRTVAIAQLPSANGFLALRRARVAQTAAQPLIGFGDPVFNASRPDTANRAVAVRSLAVITRRDEMLALVERAQKDGKPIADAAKVPIARLSEAFSMLPALPDTADELKEIAQALGADVIKDIYLGARATEKNVKSVDLSRYRVIVFATHGLVSGEIPGLDQPALALSNPQLTQDADNDGFLTMEEVLALKLNAEWVVLSACNTASGDGQASEAVSGLGRAFFYAGARSLLVSNWPVETVSARLLSTGLFRSQAANPSLARAEALRQAMLEVMAKEAYSHPVFWAPFSLIGDGGPR